MPVSKRSFRPCNLRRHFGECSALFCGLSSLVHTRIYSAEDKALRRSLHGEAGRGHHGRQCCHEGEKIGQQQLLVLPPHAPWYECSGKSGVARAPRTPSCGKGRTLSAGSVRSKRHTPPVGGVVGWKRRRMWGNYRSQTAIFGKLRDLSHVYAAAR